MLYLYLDESGDLGFFDFVCKETVEVFYCYSNAGCEGMGNRKRLLKAVKRTLRMLIPEGKQRGVERVKDNL